MNDNEKIISCHNISNTDEIKAAYDNFRNKKEITIGFLGNIRYFEENRKLIDALANNPKYKLAYVGRPNVDCDLEGYCKSKNITNAVFKGEFKNEDKPKLYKEIDLINAVYGNNSLEVTTLLPNRLYEGLLLKKPVIATNDTFLGDVVKVNKVGLCLNLDDRNIDLKIEEYILTLDFDEFSLNCEKMLREIKKEQKYFCEKIREFLKL